MFDAVILAGGRAERLGGLDKPGLEVGGTPMIRNVVAAARGAGRVIVVGPPRDIPDAVFVREDPPGAGPIPALRAGLAQVTAPWVALLAGDLPFLAPTHLATLLHATAHRPPGSSTDETIQANAHPPSGSALGRGGADEGTTQAGAHRPYGSTTDETIQANAHPPSGSAVGRGGADEGTTQAGAHRPYGSTTDGERADEGTPSAGVTDLRPPAGPGVVAVDAEGREQWLLSVWDAAALKDALAAYEGRSLRGLLGPLAGRRVALPRQAWFDCDTEDDLEEARGERAG